MQMRWEFSPAFVGDALSKNSFNLHFVKEVSANLSLPLPNTDRPWPSKTIQNYSVKHWSVLATCVFKALCWTSARRLWHVPPNAAQGSLWAEDTCLGG